MKNLEKLKEAIMLITYITPDARLLGSIKLNKIIWASDVEMYITTGKSITGSTYTKQEFGPVPKHIPTARKELIEEKRTKEQKEITVEGNEQLIIVALEKCNENVFQKKEITILCKKTMDIIENHTAKSISKHSHDIIWDSAEIGEEIPIYAYLAGQSKNIEDDDITWGNEVLSKQGYKNFLP